MTEELEQATAAGDEDSPRDEEKEEVERLGEELKSQKEVVAELEQQLAAQGEELGRLREELAIAVAKYRHMVLAAAPEVPEEMVKGETIEEIDASLTSARSLVERVRRRLEAEVEAGRVPAGAPPRSAPDLSALSPGEKIAYALARQRA